MMRRLYDWMMRMAGHKKAPQALFWVSFIESSVFPIPPDVMLIPMILAQRAKAFLYATICLAGSVIGGVAGYAIGYYLFDLIGEPILRVYGYGEKYQQTADLFNEWGAVDPDRQGLDAFPLQGAHHRRRRLQDEHRALHPRLDRGARHALLPGGSVALLVRRADPRLHREAPEPRHDGVRRRCWSAASSPSNTCFRRL